MPYVDFIPDETFITAVRKVIAVQEREKNRSVNDLFRNTLDPYSAIFESLFAGASYDQWIESERTRQAQKSTQNAIGTLHEGLLQAGAGWEKITSSSTSILGVNQDLMLDIRNSEQKVAAEIKNKHNTLTKGKEADAYDALENWITKIDKGFTAYLVHIIPKGNKPYNAEWTPVKAGVHRPANPLIRVIDGRSFYAMVFGRANALDLVFSALPSVIEDIRREKTLENPAPIIYKRSRSIKEVNVTTFTKSFEGLFQRAYPWPVETPATQIAPDNDNDESAQP